MRRDQQAHRHRATHRRPPRRLAIEALEPRQLMAGDMVLAWNELLDAAIREDNTQIGPTYAARNYTIVHGAIYDAVVGITRSHHPLLVDVVAPYYASLDAAVASAAYHALLGLYPLQAGRFDAFYEQCLENIPDGIEEDAGIALGAEVAAAILANRSTDHAGDVVPYIPGTQPGNWRPAPPIETTPAWGPGWGHVTPFVIQSGSQFRPPPPPEMTSAVYAAAFNEVKSLGAVNSTTRTADQTEIGIFWGYDRAGMGPPPIFFNQIARTISQTEGLTLEENARLFALANLAQADAGIVSWEAKYAYNFWRPITAIREADNDGNPETIADPAWEPLGAPGGSVVANFTPPFPAYTSGHATFGAAYFRMLANFLGTDAYSFDISSDELPGVVRHYDSFSQAAAENARSRIYLGIHWNFDDSFGQSTGREVADYIFDRALRPREMQPADLVVAGEAPGRPHVRVMHDDGQIMHEFFAYDPRFTGGVRVAMGDLNGDGFDEIITAAGPGGGPHVKVFDGRTAQLMREFYAYHAGFAGGVFVATGDVNGDGLEDIITGADAGGGPHVRVFNGQTGAEIVGFYAYHPGFAGGVRVAAADVDGDGDSEIITGAGPGGGPHVRVFQQDRTEAMPGFYAYDSRFRGGVFVAGGDVDGGGNDDIITGAGAGGGPHVRAFSGQTGAEVIEFFAYGALFAGGVRVAAADCNGDGRADIITTPGFGQNSTARVFQGYSGEELAHFIAFPGSSDGVYVAGGLSAYPLGQNLLATAALQRSSLFAQLANDALVPNMPFGGRRRPAPLAADLFFAREL
jgi:hypothetical protein